MTSGTMISWALLVLGATAVLVAFFYMLRALGQRSQSARAPYDVGRQEARQSMQIDLARSLGVLFVGVVLLITFAFMFGRAPEEAETVSPLPVDTAVPTRTSSPVPTTQAAPTETATAVPAATAVATNTPLLPTALPTATSLPTSTPTSSPPTATVSSGVGVWLRAAPSVAGEQLAWLLDGTEVVLLAGRETADEFEWRQVRAPDGQVGWVAAPFILLPEASDSR